MDRVLVTGFVPFADYVVNSSELVVRALGARETSGVRCEILPVDHLAANVRMIELLAEARPAVCLALGMWQGSAFRIERCGRKSPGLSALQGEEELAGDWDWEEMANTLGKTGRPVVLSEYAGKYVCDTTYWTALDWRQRNGAPR